MNNPATPVPLLLGRYRPERLLARGGSSMVFRARDENLGRDVAVKLFSSGSQDDVARFRAEVGVLAGLRHHGVVSILDAGVDDSSPKDPRPFMVIELVEGDTLRAVLNAGPMTSRQIGEVAFEVAETLEYVHARGVIHRDVTPANIMIVDYGTRFSRPRARLTDFGIAIHATHPQEFTDETVGTAAYLSPEQVQGETLTPASDIYSLGLVLLECFTGTVAYPGTPVESALARLDRHPEAPDHVSEPWRTLIQSMTRREASWRPSAADVATAARAALRAEREHQPI
ncbi:serine/threonine-protein kinase [Leifsonia sp. fls2-241-R2A-40a]|uniref:serine/threonine-protein kinase n=1 Tax=Leifsonia sp. fls2-241-R2A-40a TaxID=3040290 RepID=UPI00254D9D4C|nr:serine/threonine-protein kinase [Leifsonia sp. fls2-241-R2A-40a]